MSLCMSLYSPSNPFWLKLSSRYLRFTLFSPCFAFMLLPIAEPLQSVRRSVVRSRSAEVRKSGTQYPNVHRMKLETYEVDVSISTPTAESVRLQCHDLSKVNVLNERISRLLLLPKSRFRLVWKTQAIVEGLHGTCAQFFRFQRRPTLNCILLVPEPCEKCGATPQPASFTDALGHIEFRYGSCDWCVYRQQEYGWSTIRRWNAIVFRARRQSMRAYIRPMSLAAT